MASGSGDRHGIGLDRLVLAALGGLGRSRRAPHGSAGAFGGVGFAGVRLTRQPHGSALARGGGQYPERGGRPAGLAHRAMGRTGPDFGHAGLHRFDVRQSQFAPSRGSHGFADGLGRSRERYLRHAGQQFGRVIADGAQRCGVQPGHRQALSGPFARLIHDPGHAGCASVARLTGAVVGL